MKLIIVRHGATDHNVNRIIQGHVDKPLNNQGLLQADELGRALAEERIEQIFSSDLARARATTAAILRYGNTTSVDYMPALRERHYGEFQDGSLSDLLLVKKSYQGNWDEFQPQGGESQCEFHERVGSVWQAIATNMDKDTVLFSVHGGVAKSLITLAQKKGMDYRSTIIQDNCCLNILYGNYHQGFTVKLLNGVDHLSDPTNLEGL